MNSRLWSLRTESCRTVVRAAALGGRGLSLSRTGDLRQAAANLFAMLRELDGGGYQGIAVMKIPDHGLGRAINDRLRRAAQLS